MALAGWGLVYGLAVSALFTAVLFGGALAARDFLAQDYPPAIRDRYGAKSPRGQRVARAATIIVALGVVAILALALTHLARLAPGAGVLAVFVYAWIILQTFNLFDLVVLDWLIVVTWRPALVVLPGTEDMPEYRDLGFHVRAFAKGIVICSIGAALTAGLYAAVSALG
ncbi:hypothetical protein D5H75_31325 [Bailinhaonella thermotolerans]|uniref:Uncharacterized protein n=2 Tax=Bailinhaonella thermotolerans TaxID=1070861 RepID=A0A3A4ACZ8_9ACTN|nr:hypothetical protein D5H75_31325 [Bailinhaonella thermotolerans]